ncbi:MAG: molybdate ABC transporter substrate-binding protein [Arenicellales bacterium]|jgi:molybdate transport system substrate-binding protein
MSQGGDLTVARTHRRRTHLHRCIAAATTALIGLLVTHSIHAEETRVAVAANFTGAAAEIGTRFEKATGYKVLFSFGSTGQLFAQITQGAPFDVYLAADQARPRKAIDEGYAVPGTRFTYATGSIVLFSENPRLVRGESTLRTGKFTRLAIANPVTAPYGAAAVQAMKALDLYDALASRLVEGENIAQTYQFVKTGNAEIGFVALSQVANGKKGSRWVVPRHLYAPISQDAVLLKRGADNPAARAFVEFLGGPQAREVKRRYGYGTGF